MAKGRGESKLSPRRINAVQRALEALELRKGGATFHQIADKLGYKSAASAFKAIDRALARTLQEPTEQLRRIELERLDRMFLAIWGRAKQGDFTAVDRALGIMARRAKLLGLDAPTKIAPTNPEGTEPYEALSDEERAARITAILKRAGSRGTRPTADLGTPP